MRQRNHEVAGEHPPAPVFRSAGDYAATSREAMGGRHFRFSCESGSQSSLGNPVRCMGPGIASGYVIRQGALAAVPGLEPWTQYVGRTREPLQQRVSGHAHSGAWGDSEVEATTDLDRTWEVVVKALGEIVTIAHSDQLSPLSGEQTEPGDSSASDLWAWGELGDDLTITGTIESTTGEIIAADRAVGISELKSVLSRAVQDASASDDFDSLAGRLEALATAHGALVVEATRELYVDRGLPETDMSDLLALLGETDVASIESRARNLLLSAMSDSSPAIRYGALMGLASVLDDPARDSLKELRKVESDSLLQRIMDRVLSSDDGAGPSQT